MDACLGTRTLLCPSVLDMQQSMPQCWPGGEAAGSPHRRGREPSRTLQRWLHPQSGRRRSRDASPSSARGAPSRTSCLFGCGGRTSSSSSNSKKRKQVAGASQPVPFLGTQKADGGKAGKRRGREGRDLLPETTGNFQREQLWKGRGVTTQLLVCR